MIKDNQKIFNRIHVVLDAVIIALSYMAGYALRFMTPMADPMVPHLPFSWYMVALPFLVVGYLLLYYMFELYNPKRATGRKKEFFNIVKANSVGAIIFLSVLYMIWQSHFSRIMIFYFYLICIALTTVERNVIRLILRYFRRKGFNRKYVLVIGYSKAAESYINRLRLNPQWGYVIRGILDDNVEA